MEPAKAMIQNITANTYVLIPNMLVVLNAESRTMMYYN